MRTRKLALLIPAMAVGLILHSCSFESVRTDENQNTNPKNLGVDTINPSQLNHAEPAAAPAAPATDSTKADAAPAKDKKDDSKSKK